MTSIDDPRDVAGGRPAALDRLDVLVGVWETEATFEAGFLGPDTPETRCHGRTTFEWLDGGFFLTQRIVNDDPVPSAITIIGPSGEADTFAQHYYDSRGVARVYQMTLDGQEWKLWRESPGFWQRYTGVIAEDGTTITGAWQASVDGREWRHDFDLMYTRIG
jgi:hypothetical protein